jgi:hypothetical protein
MSLRSSDFAYRDMIKREAESHLLKVSDHPSDRVGGKRKGADFLKQVLQDACASPPSWTAANVRALETPGSWLNVNGQGGTTDSQKAVHWCGIFATYVLRRTGMPVKWISGLGIDPSGKDAKFVRKYRRWIEKFDDDAFEIGDVAAIPRANHHFVVVDVSDPLKLGCVAGNGEYQRIERQTHDRKAVNCLYKIVFDPLGSRL